MLIEWGYFNCGKILCYYKQGETVHLYHLITFFLLWNKKGDVRQNVYSFCVKLNRDRCCQSSKMIKKTKVIVPYIPSRMNPCDNFVVKRMILSKLCLQFLKSQTYSTMQHTTYIDILYDAFILLLELNIHPCLHY